jgi:hypothetical protein
MLVTKILTNSSVSNKISTSRSGFSILEAGQQSLRFEPYIRAVFLPGHIPVFSFLSIQNSMLDVGCSMFIGFIQHQRSPFNPYPNSRANMIRLQFIGANKPVGPLAIGSTSHPHSCKTDSCCRWPPDTHSKYFFALQRLKPA